MGNIEIQPVMTRKQRKQFLQLPWAIYRDDPYWVPPLQVNQEELLNFRKHPFYDDAEIATFLALRDGVAVGRIAAIINHAHNRRHTNDQRGFVGFFECIHDLDVSHRLFDAAREWCAERGMKALRGPVNPSLNYECGLLVENFTKSPTFMMTYNPDYYPGLWEDYGFEKAQDLLSFIGNRSNLETLEKKIHFIVQESIRRFNIETRPLDPRRFREDVKTFLEIYNASLGATWGHVPMSDQEITCVSRSLRHLIAPKLTTIAEIDGKPVGCTFGLLDYNPRIKKIRGRLLPFGFIRLLWRKRQIRRVRMVSTNVLPEYQRWGIGVVLASRMVPSALKFGIQEAEFSWVLESNKLSRKTLERGKVSVEKRHRIYDFIDGAKPADSGNLGN